VWVLSLGVGAAELGGVELEHVMSPSSQVVAMVVSGPELTGAESVMLEHDVLLVPQVMVMVLSGVGFAGAVGP
jgi:hypothetical protein